MTEDRVPFNTPYLVGTEAHYVAAAYAAMHLSGDGVFTKRCHRRLEEITGARKALLTTSCTHALELAALLLGVGDGDEVIVPSFTFASTANAWVLRGARPVFADIRLDTLNLDERRLEALITPRTRAIALVHYAGVACEMDEILAIARRHHVAVVEDAAHAIFGRYRGRPLGSFGTLAALSFHETKNISCGEGGALLINDEALVARAEIIREKGTNRAAFFRGEIDRYTWVDVGSSYLPSDILAAHLWAHLEASEEIQGLRMALWQRYAAGLAAWADAQGVALPVVPPHCSHPAHLFHLVMPSPADRDRLIEHLRQAGIASVFHYVPLHSSPMAKRLGAVADCPVSDRVSGSLLRLPFFAAMTAAQQERVIDAVCRFRTCAPAAAL
jgi:dTDP-4-amino-4,6-dideoxygalactose transaminase